MPFNLQEFALGLLGTVVKEHLEPRCNNVPLWDNGLGKLAEGLVQASVPNVTGDQIAEGALQMMGVKRGPRVIGRGQVGPRSVVIDAEVRR